MLIDWTTVIFQIINFLILIALLKRFLYGPIIRAMDEREKMIAGRLDDASRAREDAQGHARQLAADQREFAGKRELLQQEARQEIEKWKEESLERLKDEINLQKNNWQQSLEDEQESFIKKLKVTISRQVFDVSRKVLADLADNRLETRLIEIFLEKIKLESKVFPELNEQLTVVSGFPLGVPEREKLTAGLRKFFPGQRELVFEEEVELGFGLRLLSGALKFEWNLSRYMNDIENEILRSMGRSK